MTRTVYEVKGMTCEHCVRAVTEEVCKLDGVQGVEVDLAGGRITLSVDGPLPAVRVAAAVDDAGYELVS